MTRLTEGDVRGLIADLEAFDEGLRRLGGVSLRDLAVREAGPGPMSVPLLGARVAAVPISQGEGFIPGFAQCVVAILGHLGCEAWVTDAPDVRGIHSAVDDGARVLFLADDYRFVALNVTNGRCVGNDPSTADGYAAALEMAAGDLSGQPVMLLGLGPVGRRAAQRLVSRGAIVHAVEPDAQRLRAAVDGGLALTPVGLEEGLAHCDLIYDACPAGDIIDAGQVRPETIVAGPGMPPALTVSAQEALGVRHIHEPLAVGVAVMMTRALA